MWREKINAMVDFPYEGLNLNNEVAGPGTRDNYSLYAVSVSMASEVMYSFLLSFRADYRFAPSQWETALLCNDISHWLGANLE